MFAMLIPRNHSNNKNPVTAKTLSSVLQSLHIRDDQKRRRVIRTEIEWRSCEKDHVVGIIKSKRVLPYKSELLKSSRVGLEFECHVV